MDSNKAGREKNPANESSIATEDTPLTGENVAGAEADDSGSPETRLREAAKQLQLAREELHGEAHVAATRALVDVQRSRLRHSKVQAGLARATAGPTGPISGSPAGYNNEEYHCDICGCTFDSFEELADHDCDPVDGADQEPLTDGGYGVTD